MVKNVGYSIGIAALLGTLVWGACKSGDGTHALVGSAPFGVVVVGFDAYDSYAYPGGLNQQIINPMN